MNFLEYLYDKGVAYEDMQIDIDDEEQNGTGLAIKVRVKPVYNMREDIEARWGEETKYRREDLPVTEEHLIPFIEVCTYGKPNPWKFECQLEPINYDISAVRIETSEVIFTNTNFEVTDKLKRWLEINKEYLLNYWNSIPHYEVPEGTDYWITKDLVAIKN